MIFHAFWNWLKKIIQQHTRTAIKISTGSFCPENKVQVNWTHSSLCFIHPPTHPPSIQSPSLPQPIHLTNKYLCALPTCQKLTRWVMRAQTITRASRLPGRWEPNLGHRASLHITISRTGAGSRKLGCIICRDAKPGRREARGWLWTARESLRQQHQKQVLDQDDMTGDAGPR